MLCVKEANIDDQLEYLKEIFLLVLLHIHRLRMSVVPQYCSYLFWLLKRKYRLLTPFEFF